VVETDTIQIKIGNNTTLMDVILFLVEKYVGLDDKIIDLKTFRIHQSYKILFNGQNIDSQNDLKMKVRNGDVLALLPPVGGG
jgi:molybdopterin converting factor small subunit